MQPWKATYTVGQPIGGFPMAVFKDIGPVQIIFQLSSSQIGARTLKVATTSAFAEGRPKVTVNNWEGPSPSLPQPAVNSRGVTRGTWRGFVSCMFSGPGSTMLNVTQNQEYIVNIREHACLGGFCITTDQRSTIGRPASGILVSGNNTIFISVISGSGDAQFLVRTCEYMEAVN